MSDDPYDFDVLSKIETEAEADLMGIAAEILHAAAIDAVEDEEPNADMLVSLALEFEQRLGERRGDLRPGGLDELDEAQQKWLPVLAALKMRTPEREEE